MLSFSLPDHFIQPYYSLTPPFGGNGMGEAVFYRTYSRSDNPRLPEGVMESWTDTCRRVIEGMHSVEKDWAQLHHVNYNPEKARAAAEEAFDLMWNMKWLPPGRGLQMMGTAFVHERGVVEALQNCGFVSTRDLSDGEPFAWLMKMSMLGVGVGFDTKGAGAKIYEPTGEEKYIVEDSREGWADSIKRLLDGYLKADQPATHMVYEQVRPAGSSIRGFGGTASGPEALQEAHSRIDGVLASRSDGVLDSQAIVDIMNIIGVAVVSGNARRSAEIAIGSPDDESFLDLKDPDRTDRPWGWMSNNSIFVETDKDEDYYLPFAERTWKNGEPGYIWMDNVHHYERMNKILRPDDWRADGFNPCSEQPLEHKELCTLGEVFPTRIENLAEARRVMKHAYRYGKIVTLLSDRISDPDTRKAMKRNRRIGLSLTGITRFDNLNGRDELIHWLNSMYNHVDRYDALYSQWYKVPRSIRMTSVKPSGTVSLLPMVTPGIHYDVAGRYVLRRVNMPAHSKLAEMLKERGYPVEPSVYTPGTWSVGFPIDMGAGSRSETEVSPRDHAELISTVNRYWCGNNSSATIKFDRDQVGPAEIASLLVYLQDKAKAISFLPLEGHGYKQAPYESLTKAEYEALVAGIEPFTIEGEVRGLHEINDEGCDGETCVVAPVPVGGDRVVSD